MAITTKQKKILDDFAKQNSHWPKEQLALALWRIKWDITALDHQKEPAEQYDTLFLCAGRGAG